MSDALGGVPLFRAGDKVPVDSSLPNPKPEGSLKKEDCHDTSVSIATRHEIPISVG